MERYNERLIFISLLVVIEIFLLYFSSIGDPAQLGLTSDRLFSIQVGVILIYIAIFWNSSFRYLRSKLDPIAQSIDAIRDRVLSAHHIYPLGEESFYQEFFRKIETAEVTVYMSHLGIIPPTQTLANAQSYYGSLWDLLKRKRNVEIKRVEMYSEEKVEWIQEIVDQMSEVRGFSLYVIDSRQLNEGVARLPVAVQIADDSVYLVAISRHHDRFNIRDIAIEGEDVRTLWASYFDEKLIGASECIIANGQRRPDAIRKYLGD